ncbi:MAG: DUF3854 domain-containing protein, partial [Verrucomicrobiae bacterium]|nr:DUF3854 domain-containing protein [Verrucomicrobiae bacterium]
MVFPYRNLDGSEVMDDGRPFVRLRLEKPIGSMKYYQPKGSQPHGYLPPQIVERRFGPAIYPLVVIEGEKKALALTDVRFPAVGISGFYGFADKEGAVVPELEEVADWIQPRQVFFAGDRDVVFNAQFSDAAFRFREAFPNRHVRVMCVPLNAPEKGFDDCRRAYKDDNKGFVMECLSPALTLSVDADDFASPGDLAIALLNAQAPLLGTERCSLSDDEVR